MTDSCLAIPPRSRYPPIVMKPARLGLGLAALLAAWPGWAEKKRIPADPAVSRGFNTRQLVDWALDGPRDAWVELALDQMVRSGAATHRLNVLWADVQPGGPGEWRWERYDRVIEAAARRGLSAILNPTGSPAWARGPERRGARLNEWAAPDPERTADWEAFVAALAARYRGKAHAFEIWNEQNSHRFWGQSRADGTSPDAPSPAQWARLFCSAASRIRAEAPGALVGTGGLAPHVRTRLPNRMRASEFLRRAFDVGLAACKPDFAAFHLYLFQENCGDRLRVDAAPQAAELAAIRSVLKAAGLPHLPVWNTEWGVPSRTFLAGRSACPFSEKKQAALVARQERYAAALKLPFSIYFNVRDEDRATTNPNSAIGLLRADFTAKPALAAWMSAAQ